MKIKSKKHTTNQNDFMKLWSPTIKFSAMEGYLWGINLLKIFVTLFIKDQIINSS